MVSDGGEHMMVQEINNCLFVFVLYYLLVNNSGVRLEAERDEISVILKGPHFLSNQTQYYDSIKSFDVRLEAERDQNTRFYKGSSYKIGRI